MAALTYERAEEILFRHLHSKKMLRHSFSVAVAMREAAKDLGEDADLWEAVSPIHDVDFEEFPEAEHCQHLREVLEPEGVDEWMIVSLGRHGYDRYPVTPPVTLYERVLCATDRLCWVAVAAARRREDVGENLTVEETLALLKDPDFDAKFDSAHVYRDVGRYEFPLEQVADWAVRGVRKYAHEIAECRIGRKREAD